MGAAASKRDSPSGPVSAFTQVVVSAEESPPRPPQPMRREDSPPRDAQRAAASVHEGGPSARAIGSDTGLNTNTQTLRDRRATATLKRLSLAKENEASCYYVSTIWALFLAWSRALFETGSSGRG